ncbi:hypothetical protein AAAC51_06020 [Priestia megaterium]
MAAYIVLTLLGINVNDKVSGITHAIPFVSSEQSQKMTIFKKAMKKYKSRLIAFKRS